MAELHHGDVTGAASGPSEGDGHYAAYHALWHLFEIGVVDDLKTFQSAAWDLAETSKKRTRVALLDVSVAYRHPNLETAIATDLMIDFFSCRFGAFPFKDAAADTRLAKRCADATVTTPLPDPTVAALFDKLKGSLAKSQKDAALDWKTPLIVHPATNPIFSAHGTAMAGLIGARPRAGAEVKFEDTVRIPAPGDYKLTAEPTENRGFPYAGVDPYCEIVPISTSFDPDPEQLILALLYAHIIGADLIVTARDYADPYGASIAGASAGHGKLPQGELDLLEDAYPAPIPKDEVELWKALGKLTIQLSKTIPIVCAAGNGGDETIILPGALAADDNGIIAVGARAATGKRAGYSSTGTQPPAAPRITIYAPSGDGERLDDDPARPDAGLQRLDTAAPGFRRSEHGSDYRDALGVHYRGDGGATGLSRNTFSTQEIVSTDVPGAAGYNGSAFSPSTAAGVGILDYRSYYCHFSGTSAAAAITGGMLSLAMAAGKIAKGDGAAAKAKLTDGVATDDKTAQPALHWANVKP